MTETLIIADAGNTTLKLAVVEDDQFIKVYRLPYQQLDKWFNENSDMKNYTCVFSSVVDFQIETRLKNFFFKTFKVSHESELPFQNNYSTPDTLGIDRICNAAAITVLNAFKNSVSIDIGTCVKFDFVDASGCYQGGSISPGIQLRYKALHDYTAKLPLLKSTESVSLIGTDTNSSIASGVINGMQAEITEMIHRYECEYEGLTFFMTGGDARHFDFEGKNNIFADENLTLKGLLFIFRQNVQ